MKNKFPIKPIAVGISILILVILVVLFFRTPYWTAITKSKNHFLEIEADDRVLYEPGAAEIAGKFATFLPEAINTVEEKHAAPFLDRFTIYVCNSQQSLNEYLGIPPGLPIRGAVLGKHVFLAPSAFNFMGMDTYRESIMHELSHLLMKQHLGWIAEKKIPIWFREGLADYAAGSGGEGIREEEAILMILNGTHFDPVDRSSVFSSFRNAMNNLSGPMFHKQAKMFVTFVAENDPGKFNALIEDLLSGESFRIAISSNYTGYILDQWSDFVKVISH